MAGDFLARLAAILGPHGLLTDPADMAPFATDWRQLRAGRPLAVALPENLAQVSATLAACHAARIAVVPQGGNTGLAAGAAPGPDGDQLVLGLGRMARIRDIDAEDRILVIEAGATLAAAQAAAASVGCLLPLSLAAEGTAQIGGVLSTNAGGIHTLRFGNARDMALGLEVALADGSVIHGLRRLRKDNTGYALRQLFIGAEGTLGVITAAVLRLVPAPVSRALAFCAVPNVSAALALLFALQREAGQELYAFEYLSAAALDLVLRELPRLRHPLAAPSAHYLLIEMASTRPADDPRAMLEQALETALAEGGLQDAVVAQSEAQMAAFWAVREGITEAQHLAGASLKNDVSVPVRRIPSLLDQAAAACTAIMPDVVVAPFGHLGDGNIHLNLIQPRGADPAAFLAHAPALTDAVDAIVRSLDGSFSAEHGIGQLKTAQLAQWRGGAERDAMRAIKHALDPLGLLNPRTLLPG